MSAPDFRISSTFTSHPKTKRLIRRLGFQGAWSLVCLMAWVTANRRNLALAPRYVKFGRQVRYLGRDLNEFVEVISPKKAASSAEGGAQ